MNTIYSANILLTLLSGIVVLSGLYLLMGLCCKGNRFSKFMGGFIGATGLAGFLLAVVPTCF